MKFLFKSIDDFFLKIIKILIPIIFFIPLFLNSAYFFPFVFPKNILFRLIIGLIFSIYSVLFIRNREKYKPISSKIFLSYLFFGLFLTISSLVNNNFLYSFWSNYERMDGLINLYCLLGLFIVILGVYYRKKAWLELLHVSIFVSFIVSYIALAQHLNISLFISSASGTRISSFFGNATYLATYSLFHFFFSIYLIFKDKVKYLRLELFGFYILDFFLIFLETKAQLKGFTGPLSSIFSNIYLLILFLLPQILLHLNYYFSNIKYSIIKNSKKLYFIVLASLNFFALFNTQTRGVVVGIFISILVLLIFNLFSNYVVKKIKNLSFIFIFLIFFLVISIFLFKDSQFIQNNQSLRRISNISINDTTAKTRLLTWQASIKGFKEKPILGWGEEQFYVVFNKYFPTDIYRHQGSRVWFDRPHNIFLQHLIHGGILALFAYLSIFFFVFYYLFKHYKRTHDVKTITILGALTISYLIQNFFVFDSFNNNILVILLLAMVIFITKSKDDINKSSKNKYNENSFFLPSILFLLIIFITYIINVPQIKANKDFVEKLRGIQKDNSMNVFNIEKHDSILEIINTQYLGRFEMRQAYMDNILNILKNKNITKENKRKVLYSAEKEMLKSIEEQPNNVRNHVFLTNLYIIIAESLDPDYANKNIEIISKAIELSPTRTQLYYGLGRSYMIIGDYKKSIDNFSIAKNLSPNVFESYTHLIAIYLFDKNFEESKKIVEEIFNNDNLKSRDTGFLSSNNYSRLAEIYFVFDQVDYSLELLNQGLLHYPEEIKLLAQIILYYYDNNDLENVNLNLETLSGINELVYEDIKNKIGL